MARQVALACCVDLPRLWGMDGEARLLPGGPPVVPALELDPPSAFVLRNEPLSRGRGKAHMIEFASRRGGQIVWVNRRHPSGISDARYRRLHDEHRAGRACDAARRVPRLTGGRSRRRAPVRSGIV
jgi:hypothetical protein